MRKGRRDVKLKGTRAAVLTLKDGGNRPQTSKCGWTLEARDGFDLTASKEMGSVFLQPQETEFCQQYKSKRKRSLP